jgi:hypothetical protein
MLGNINNTGIVMSHKQGELVGDGVSGQDSHRSQEIVYIKSLNVKLFISLFGVTSVQV